MRIAMHGVVLEQGIEIVYLHSDPKLGRWLLFRGEREEVEIRVTKGGRLRVSAPRQSGCVRADGVTK